MDSEQLCRELVRDVAAVIHDEHEFLRKARQAAEALGSESIEVMAKMFHDEPSPPPELADRFPGLGNWIAARQFAIFEIFYNLGESALPVLRRVAFGEYDWTQGNAIEVLCRLAANGIQRDSIVAEIQREFPKLRYEAQLYAVGPILKQAETNSQLANVLAEFEVVPEYREIVEELTREFENDNLMT